MKKVLADFHHGDLFESLRILFVDRLGWDLYRPIGLEWYHEGFWNVYPHIDTAKQYLSTELGIEPKDIRGNPVTKDHGRNAWLNRNLDQMESGIYIVLDPNHGGRLHKAVELKRARDMKFDFIVSSIPDHFRRFEIFRSRYCPNAKHIFQMGNAGWSLPNGAKNLLNSTSYNPPSGVNHVRYHQEFCLKEFSYSGKPGYLGERSLCNLMHWQSGHFPNLFEELKDTLTKRGWIVKNFGAGNEHGAVDDVANVLKQFSFVWHVKRGGDGYGYNIHNSFACGRPMVISSKQTRGQLASCLFEECVTTVDVDGKPISRVADQLDIMARNYEAHTLAVHLKFKSHVDFDAEAQEIMKFLENAA